MALHQPCPIISTRFSYKDFVFSAEASDFNGLEMGRVYDDAIDIGFTIISAHTGQPAVFAEVEPERDAEGEIVAFWFDCVTPHLRHLKACLFND